MLAQQISIVIDKKVLLPRFELGSLPREGSMIVRTTLQEQDAGTGKFLLMAQTLLLALSQATKLVS